MESTGLTDEFGQMFESLRKDFSVRLIKIQAGPELCLRRVTNRDSIDHINVSDADVEEINKLAKKINYDYDLVIDNNVNTEDGILKEFYKILKPKP
jgi:dephospho-CoA kinase